MAIAPSSPPALDTPALDRRALDALCSALGRGYFTKAHAHLANAPGLANGVDDQRPLAAMRGRSIDATVAMVRRLLEAGADPRALYKNGTTLLSHHVTVLLSPPQVLRCLLEGGADLHQADAFWGNALACAAASRRSSALIVFLAWLETPPQAADPRRSRTLARALFSALDGCQNADHAQRFVLPLLNAGACPHAQLQPDSARRVGEAAASPAARAALAAWERQHGLGERWEVPTAAPPRPRL